MPIHHTACVLCSRNCGLVVETEGAEFRKIRGDDSSPATKGYLCQKAARLAHYQSHDDRLRTPLKRQPDGSFEPVGWDEALGDIARRLLDIRRRHGGKAFASYGGGGQGNHLGAAYSRQLMKAMGSNYVYNALGQEKTGDFWVNGRLFGKQSCHVTEDVEHADVVLFIGTNPYEAHGIPNARDTLKHLHKDAQRTMVVIDPRRTATAKLADVHLQLRPGTDAFLMAAILAIIVREGLHDAAFLQRRCSGFEAVEAALRDVPVADFIRHADVPADDVHRVARAFAQARRACVRIDLGIQQSLNSTLNSYLEKLLFLVTGNFGIEGGNNLHSSFIPVIGHSDETNPRLARSARLGMFPIAGIFPPSILAREIDNENDDRVRALFVDSGNPALTIADTPAIEAALARLELLVVVDVAMTETARHAHYVLPASSQYEKFEATGFNFEFPTNYFHLRRPVFAPLGDSLPEAEIYTRLLERMGAVPPRFPILEWLATHEPAATRHLATVAGLALRFATRPALAPFGASILYRTLGKALGRDAGAVTMLPLAMAYAARHPAAVARAGVKGNRLTRGANLFRRILGSPQGAIISEHQQEEVWSFVRTADGLVHLEIPELLAQLRALKPGDVPDAAFPLVLMAGERRSYNANQIFRDPAWRKTDAEGAMRIHPSDARKYELVDGGRALCRSRRGAIEVTIAVDDATRPGLVSLPHGYGMRYRDGAPQGPELNRLTALEDCDPLTYTPHHKFVPVSVGPAA